LATSASTQHKDRFEKKIKKKIELTRKCLKKDFAAAGI
jgi:hypothetical protein